MQQTRSCFCYSPAHGAVIIGIAFFIGSTVVSLMLVGLVVEWNEVLQTIKHNNGNGTADEGDCEPHNFSQMALVHHSLFLSPMFSMLDALLHLIIIVKLAMAVFMLIFSVWMLLGIKEVKYVCLLHCNRHDNEMANE